MSEDSGLTRRQALGVAAALCGFGALAQSGSAQAAAPSATLRVPLSKYPALNRVGGIAMVGNLGSTPVAVVRTATSTYIALSRICPHQGGTVAQSGSGFQCPRHFATFSSTGAKVSGPVSSGLRQLSSRLSRNTLIITG